MFSYGILHCIVGPSRRFSCDLLIIRWKILSTSPCKYCTPPISQMLSTKKFCKSHFSVLISVASKFPVLFWRISWTITFAAQVQVSPFCSKSFHFSSKFENQELHIISKDCSDCRSAFCPTGNIYNGSEKQRGAIKLLKIRCLKHSQQTVFGNGPENSDFLPFLEKSL